MLTSNDWEAMYKAQEDDLRKFRADAERARWCEEMKADVKFSLISQRWHVSWVINGDYCAVNHPDRNAAIDAAMKVGVK